MKNYSLLFTLLFSISTFAADPPAVTRKLPRPVKTGFMDASKKSCALALEAAEATRPTGWEARQITNQTAKYNNKVRVQARSYNGKRYFADGFQTTWMIIHAIAMGNNAKAVADKILPFVTPAALATAKAMRSSRELLRPDRLNDFTLAEAKADSDDQGYKYSLAAMMLDPIVSIGSGEGLSRVYGLPKSPNLWDADLNWNPDSREATPLVELVYDLTSPQAIRFCQEVLKILESEIAPQLIPYSTFDDGTPSGIPYPSLQVMRTFMKGNPHAFLANSRWRAEQSSFWHNIVPTSLWFATGLGASIASKLPADFGSLISDLKELQQNEVMLQRYLPSLIPIFYGTFFVAENGQVVVTHKDEYVELAKNQLLNLNDDALEVFFRAYFLSNRIWPKIVAKVAKDAGVHLVKPERVPAKIPVVQKPEEDTADKPEADPEEKEPKVALPHQIAPVDQAKVDSMVQQHAQLSPSNSISQQNVFALQRLLNAEKNGFAKGPLSIDQKGLNGVIMRAVATELAIFGTGAAVSWAAVQFGPAVLEKAQENPVGTAIVLATPALYKLVSLYKSKKTSDDEE